MALLIVKDAQGRPIAGGYYMLARAAGLQLRDEATRLVALLQLAIGDDHLTPQARHTLLAQALASAEAHALRAQLLIDDKPIDG